MDTTTSLLRPTRVSLRGIRRLVAAACFVLYAAPPSLLSQAVPGSGAAPAAAPVTAASSVPLQNIPIGPGDLLDIEVFATPELSGRLRVDQLGEVTLPLGGSVPVNKMLVAEAAEAIRQRLISSQIMLAPSVSVSILEYATQGVTVLGEVRSPGVYTLLGPRSLYDALASAGGATSSQGSIITIAHAHDADHPITVEITTTGYSPIQKSTIVVPGDTVVVNRAPLVYVVGDIGHSGAFYIQVGQRLTVLDIVALADGPNRTAAMSAASILRETPQGIQTIHFNLTKVMRNQEPNPVLQGGDVFVLPRSGWKSFEVIALPGLSNALSSAATAALITH